MASASSKYAAKHGFSIVPFTRKKYTFCIYLFVTFYGQWQKQTKETCMHAVLILSYGCLDGSKIFSSHIFWHTSYVCDGIQSPETSSKLVHWGYTQHTWHLNHIFTTWSREKILHVTIMGQLAETPKVCGLIYLLLNTFILPAWFSLSGLWHRGQTAQRQVTIWCKAWEECCTVCLLRSPADRCHPLRLHCVCLHLLQSSRFCPFETCSAVLQCALMLQANALCTE